MSVASHIVGTIQSVQPAVVIGPASGLPAGPPNTWALDFSHTPANDGTRFLMLHFRNVSLPASNRLEVDLGYGKDVFTAADGTDFWTRPINIHVLAGGLVPIRYIVNGAANGGAEVAEYGRGERHPGHQDPTALSNCDPFLSPHSFPAPDFKYTEPKYDPFWYCADPPNWENVACVSAVNDIRKTVAKSAGMILSVHNDHLSTCSVTLVGPDLVVSAGHCLDQNEVKSASVTFDYEVQCDGKRPSSYNARFHKVVELVEWEWDGTIDYSLLRITPAAAVPVIQMRHTIPNPGEPIFGIHHPNGAVKKLSVPHPQFDTVLKSDTNYINVHTFPGALDPSFGPNFHVTGGSSGSGLYDTAGRIVGVLSRGDPCGNAGTAYPLTYFPIATMLERTKSELTDIELPTLVARVIIGLIEGGSGIIFLPGSGPVPVDPAPFRKWGALFPSQRDVLMGLAIHAYASLVGNAKARRQIEISGLETIKRAVDDLLRETAEGKTDVKG